MLATRMPVRMKDAVQGLGLSGLEFRPLRSSQRARNRPACLVV